MPPSPHRAIDVLTYRLTRADALAWLSLPREMLGLRRMAFLLWLGMGGMVLGLLQPDWIGEDRSLRFWAALLAAIAVQWGLAAVWMTLWRHWRAGRMIPQPVNARVEVWGDHLAAVQGYRHLHIAPEMLRNVVLTPGHVFLDAPPEVVILPRAAFASDADMRAFAAHWDRASHEAVP